MQILRDNQFNFQVSAMIPAFMVLYASSSLLFSALRIASEPRDTTQLIFTFRLILRDVHRLLTLSQPARATAAVARALQLEPNAPPLTALLAPLWSSAQLHAQVCTAVSKSQSAGGLSFATLSNMAAPIAHFAALHEAVQRFVGGRCGADMNAPIASSSSSSPAPATASTSAPALGGVPASERPGRASVGEASGRSASPASPPTSSPTQHALAFFPTSAHGPANASPVSFVGEHVALTPVVSPIETGALPSPSLLLPEVTYTGLPPQQLGELAVLLSRLAQLLSQLRRSMPFAEWSRMSQDLADLSSPQLSEPQRVQTVQRLQTSYSAISLPASTAATTSFLLSGASLPL
ncbi:MAG: hypothetical protein EOO41_00965 [Methanobacteriota archaeon]|nr:MAG: hypothetical protein EOO41_00965 [Euryarchaeota archaeon]